MLKIEVEFIEDYCKLNVVYSDGEELSLVFENWSATLNYIQTL